MFQKLFTQQGIIVVYVSCSDAADKAIPNDGPANHVQPSGSAPGHVLRDTTERSGRRERARTVCPWRTTHTAPKLWVRLSALVLL